MARAAHPNEFERRALGLTPNRPVPRFDLCYVVLSAAEEGPGETIPGDHRCIFALRSFSFRHPGLRQISESLYNGLEWRMVGPFRGGRTRAAAGVPSQPNVFYMTPVNGGVWKSDDYGRSWNPIFDQESTQSIGAIAVAPSD